MPLLRRAAMALLLTSGLATTAGSAQAQMWRDATPETIGETGEWSNKVELADIDGDGDVDILFANGGEYSTAGDPQPNRVFLNKLESGTVGFVEATEQVLGPRGDLARVIKARDVTGDGIVDIIVGGGHQTQARLYVGAGGGRFDEVTETHLPAGMTSMGDLEVGDVDGDGDLDMVSADWGPGDAMRNNGGPILLWLNDGSGRFTDASAQIPSDPIRMSWDLELIDIDNDFDLDLLVSCKMCVDSAMFTNDGAGNFTAQTFDPGNSQPQGTENNYEFEWLDANGDGFLDVVTINDGDLDDPSNGLDLRERLFINNRNGGFEDATSRLWPTEANIGADDNAIVVLDADSDGDPDFLIAALGPDPDRLLLNDGSGNLTLQADVFSGPETPGTLGIAVADLNGDGKLDVVQSQGELADTEHVYFGEDIAVDSAPPVITIFDASGDRGPQTIRARVHDNKTPVKGHDFQTVEVVTETGRAPMTWVGEALWRASVELPATGGYSVCATDAAGNQRCVDVEPKADDLGETTDAGGCQSAEGHGPMGALFLLLLLCVLKGAELGASAYRS